MNIEKTHIPLIIGKPGDGSRTEHENINIATFSRFVLPFAYQITADNWSHTKDLFYEVHPQKNISFIKRRKYFTGDTALTLYDRALWLDMSDEWSQTTWGKAEVEISIRNRNFKIGMLKPRIILFEAANQEKMNRLAALSKNKEKDNILHTGFLMTDIYFPEQEEKPELDDLLMLNEYFRYFGMPYDSHEKYFKSSFGKMPVNYSLEQDEIKLETLNKLACYFERWNNLLTIPIKQGQSCFQLFPQSWGSNAKKLAYNQGKSNSTENWMIYADNRCYTWTAAFLEDGGKTLQKSFPSEDKTLEAKNYGHWIKLLNVDNPAFCGDPGKTHASPTEFERGWAEERTYKRWEESGAWYGFSYHSAALLSNKEYFIFSPYSSYYFDTSLLLFFNRMSLFRYSKALTDAVVEKLPEIERRNAFRNLRKSFSEFTVLFRFPLLSNQQQSIEMYELNRRYFSIEEFFSEVQQEIDNTHEFVEAVHASKLSSSANRLATWGLPLAAAGVVAAIFGMNINDFNLYDCLVRNPQQCPVNLEATSLVTITLIPLIGILLYKLPGWINMAFRLINRKLPRRTK